MYTWMCFIAVVFVFVCYFSELGLLWTQSFFCFLCFVNFPLKNQGRETSTQTDHLIEDTTQQTKRNHVGNSDEPDAAGADQILPHTMQYPNVKRSLLNVFENAYVHLVQPWYTAPELRGSQPLYRTLQKEFNLIVEKIMCKAKNIDVPGTSVGCIRIVTQHLHNAKQSDGSPLFSSRFEEMAVLRTFSEALVRNLVPESLWETKLYQCVLTEIVATKVLDVLVTNLCNPDNLNQMVVLKLDTVTPKSSIGELVNSEREGTPSSIGSEGAEVLTDETEDSRPEDTKEKKKSNRIKETFFKIVGKVKSKKPKKKKLKKEKGHLHSALSARRSAVIESDGLISSNEGSVKSLMDSENDSDLDVYMTSVQEDRMEFKLSYEMWRVMKWAVRVTKVQKENDELCFTIHLEERNNPENLHWDVRKTQSDILDFYSHSIEEMDTSALPSISTVVERSNSELDDTYTKEVRSALENFLQGLVSDEQLSHSQPVFQFFCPLARLLCDEEQGGGVWGLLSGIAHFLNEESHNLRREDKPDEAGARQPACIDTVDEPEEDIVEDPNLRSCTPHEEFDQGSQISDEAEIVPDGPDSLAESLDSFLNRSKVVNPTVHFNDVSSSINNLYEGLQADTIDIFRNFPGGKTNKKEKLTHKKSNDPQKVKGKEKSGQLKEETTNQPQVQRKELQTNWEKQEATKAIFDLLKEITGNSFLINIFDAILKPVMPLVKKRINNFLNGMNPTESQIASYIDTFRDSIWPDGNVPVQQPRSIEEINETKERALQLINLKYSNPLILKKTDVEIVFKIFQDVEENKKLIYMLLSYVLREFLPGEPAFSTIANLTVKDFVSS